MTMNAWLKVLALLAIGIPWGACFQVPRGSSSGPLSVNEGKDRRHFLRDILMSGSLLSTFLSNPTCAIAANDKPVVIKVSPVSHTFITSSGSPKPIRENDTTRFFTNARVVFLLGGNEASPSLAADVIDLTIKRKAEQGAGVTPGAVQTLKSSSVKAIAEKARAMPAEDVLLVGPIASGGTAADGKLLADTAEALGTFVGGKTGGGVISVLLDGPKEGLKFQESGYPISDLLWYSLP